MVLPALAATNAVAQLQQYATLPAPKIRRNSFRPPEHNGAP